MSHIKEIKDSVLETIIHNYNLVKNNKIDLIDFDEFMSILDQNIQFFDKNYLNHEIIESYYNFRHFDMRTEALILHTLWDVLSNNYIEIKYGDEKFKSLRIIERKQAHSNNELYPLGTDPYNPLYAQFPFDFYIGRYLLEFETTQGRVDWLGNKVMQLTPHAVVEKDGNGPYSILLAECNMRYNQLIIERNQELSYDVYKNDLNLKSQNQNKFVTRQGKLKEEDVQKLEDLFFVKSDMAIFVKVLQNIELAFLDENNRYTKFIIKGFVKDIYETFAKSSKPIIKPVKKETLNRVLSSSFEGLDLSKKGSEYSKQYKRLDSRDLKIQLLSLFAKFSTKSKSSK